MSCGSSLAYRPERNPLTAPNVESACRLNSNGLCGSTDKLVAWALARRGHRAFRSARGGCPVRSGTMREIFSVSSIGFGHA
jgi:hypothetical protein